MNTCSTQNQNEDVEEIENDSSNISKFDNTVGHIEDILIDEEFLQLQKDFLEKYWMEFDSTEENKLRYTEIFEEYVSIVENYIEMRLNEKIANFDFEEFYDELMRTESLEGEVFEMLYTLSDFVAFKEMVLDYRNDKEGRTVDFSRYLLVKPLNPLDQDSLLEINI